MFQSAVLHADETPVAMLKPGNKKTHRAYLWAYTPGAFEDLKAVVYDFCESRASEHARTFLGDWSGGLVCDDFSGYKASFGAAITEVGCMAHARRKFFDLHVSNKSEIALADEIDHCRRKGLGVRSPLAVYSQLLLSKLNTPPYPLKSRGCTWSLNS